MALCSAHSILWFDSFIGKPDEYERLKKLFQADLAPAAASFPLPIDPIDALICCIREYGAPISFADSVSNALELIEVHLNNGKIVTIIMSASLGKEILPAIQQREFHIDSFYIFCGNMRGNVEWVMEYLDDGLDIQMFDFEITLLVRLARDFSNKLIDEGKRLLTSDPEAALNYFECALALAENAVERDKPTDPNDRHQPSTKHRSILNGESGLIAHAKRACNH